MVVMVMVIVCESDAKSFGRHGALSHDLWGVLGVTVRSLMMFEESCASRCAAS